MSEILETFGVDWRLLVIQAINFTLLLIVLWYFLYRPVLRMIEMRRAKIEKGVRDAEQAETQLAETEVEKGQIISEATRKAGELFEEAKQRGIEKEQEIVETAQSRSDAIITDAEAKAAEAKRQAIEESREEIARLAVLGAEKVLRHRGQ